MTVQRLNITLTVLLAIILGGSSTAWAQKAPKVKPVAKTKPVAKAKATAKKQSSQKAKVKKAGTATGFKFKGSGFKSKSSSSATGSKLRPAQAKTGLKAPGTKGSSSSGTSSAKLGAKATTQKRAEQGVAAPAAKKGPTTKAEAKAAKALAKQKKAELRKQKKQDAKEGDKAKAENRVMPERKTPIHQKLKDPNFFGEKDKIESPPTLEQVSGFGRAIEQLGEPTNHFFSGDVGRLMAARLVSRSGRNDADFRYTYGQKSFQNFAKADALLNRIPKGEFSKNLSVELLTEVNRTAFAKGGDGLGTRIGKSLRNAFFPKAKSGPGDIRNYQSYAFAKKGLSAEEVANIQSHGAKFVKLPLFKAGWIVYANKKNVKGELDKLIKETQNKLNDPSADPVQTAGRFVQRFIALHPFADGNGRTARLVMDRMLAEKGILPPILKKMGNDIGMTEQGYATEILNGIGRTKKFLGAGGYSSTDGELGRKTMHGAAGYVERMMKEYGHSLNGSASTKLVKREGLSYGLGKDGFVYDLAGRPHMADKQGNLRPMSTMTTYILMRRVSQQKNASKILDQITAPTRAAFEKMAKAKSPAEGPKILSDMKAIKNDGKLEVGTNGIDNKMLLSLMNTKNIPSKTLFGLDKGSSKLTSIMSRYQQVDLEMWQVKQAFAKKGDKAAVAKIEKHRDQLFARAKAELRKHVKKGDKSDDNPLGAKEEFERIQYQYSALRYNSRKDYTKKHGDSEAYVFRGENFAKWTGVHIDAIPFRPGLKTAAGMRAKKNGALNLYDDLNAVQGDTVGTGVQSYTTDLALLARKGGFADSHKSMDMNIGAMGSIGKGLVSMRIKDGETIEVTPKTGLVSALLSRKIVTRPGHFNIREMNAKDMKEFVEKNAPADKVEALTERIAQTQKANKGQHMLVRMANWFRGPQRFSVKADDILDASQLASFNNSLNRTRNLISVTRKGDALKVTAHRRANVFKVKKTDMLPGTDSLAGTFVNEQEVHVMASVLPHRILDTFTQKQLSTKLDAPAADAPKKTDSGPGTKATTPPQASAKPAPGADPGKITASTSVFAEGTM